MPAARGWSATHMPVPTMRGERRNREKPRGGKELDLKGRGEGGGGLREPVTHGDAAEELAATLRAETRGKRLGGD